MARPRRRRTGGLPALAGVALATALTGCAGEASLLDPAGPAARRVSGLWWVMFWISMVVFVVVLGFLVVTLARSRARSETVDRRPVKWGEPFIVAAGVIIPAVVLIGLFLLSLRDTSELSGPSADEGTPVTVEVVAKDWWWEVTYPESGAVTANEIHIPAGEPVRVRLLSTDVIHSFWVPRLQVKKDNLTDRVNELWLEADEPGRYRGQCAEFCGLQHANMLFYVIAEPRSRFDQWLEDQAEPAVATESAGRDVFLSSACSGCHTVRGTSADAQVGPDLTHLASRSTIAAGILANDRANLALFVTDPQGVKPGAIMPPTELTGEELTALLDYLESLD